MIADKTLLFTRCATSNASRHFKSPLAMGRDAFKPKHASSVSISEVIDTGVNSNQNMTFSHKKRAVKNEIVLYFSQLFSKISLKCSYCCVKSLFAVGATALS